MNRARPRTLRYIRSWLTGRDDVHARELMLDREGTSVPATLVTPRQRGGALPSWVVLHGITRPGRKHGQLVRFTRSLAESGCAVIVPEVPEWRELDLAPELTVPTVAACLDALDALPGLVSRQPPALMGFSFGAPQAMLASRDPRLAGRVEGVAGFGGYCDLERTLLFQFTGRHDWNGTSHLLRPDPYGRWIAGANYLTSVPGFGGADDVANGLRSLAALAGDVGVVAWDPCFDGPKAEIRGRLPAARRALFDLFAPHSDLDPEPAPAEEMAHLLASAARRSTPLADPGPWLGAVPGPVHLLHGRQDRLVPFSEMHRLSATLGPGVLARGTVTRLFAHSSQDPLPSLGDGIREATAFLRALSGVLGLV